MKSSVYPESFLEKRLQTQISFSLNDKVIKKGRLILYKKQHFFIHMCLLNDKNLRENFEIPIPFNIEFYTEENLVYFDYRLSALRLEIQPIITKKICNNFYDKILEISY